MARGRKAKYHDDAARRAARAMQKKEYDLSERYVYMVLLLYKFYSQPRVQRS